MKINYILDSRELVVITELADKKAKLAANITRTCLKPISASDMKPHIKQQILSFWNTKWQSLSHNKLKNIGTEIGKKQFNNFYSRIDQVKFTRIRLGHTIMTHSFFFTGENIPICQNCNSVENINHIFTVCPKYQNERTNCFGQPILTINSLKEILNRKNFDKNKSVILFLKATNLFTKI